jgi:hypothetical protein
MKDFFMTQDNLYNVSPGPTDETGFLGTVHCKLDKLDLVCPRTALGGFIIQLSP